MNTQPASWLNPRWQYQGAQTHSTAEAFAARQRERLAAAQKSTQPKRSK